ncbi:MAG: exopolysaccharide biosynthesis polyprenyl glycosylphosphotransferase [Lachnospiraceae bacterium]|nr:exopolysaccharide biosynthesis polyprenyl glycosylphosphotransferase [Lachnospiraceae bacterium]
MWNTSRFMLRCLKGLDAVLVTLVFSVCFYIFSFNTIQQANRYFVFCGMIIVFFLLYCIFGKIYDAFTVSLFRISELVYSQVLAYLLTDTILYICICLMQNKLISLYFPFLMCVFQFPVVILWCKYAHKWYFKSYPPKKSIVVYDMREGLEKLIGKYELGHKFNVDKVVTSEECLQQLDMLQNYETVFFSGVHSHERNVILKYCIMNRIVSYVIPRIGDVIMRSAKPVHMLHLPVMRVTYYNPSPFYLFIKRVFDILVAFCALLVLSPVFVITAIAIKVSDGGPVFYKQERMTKNGKKFMIHKFRSMRVDAEKDGVARLSSGENDDRITSVGRFIRKVRIDELPQLIDILAGNLSIVGPRPEREEIALQYEKEMPEFRLRLQAKAGLTGYAQVYGKYNSTPYDKLQMDLLYLANPSFVEDLRICFATVKILFMSESTDGVSTESTTALMK